MHRSGVWGRISGENGFFPPNNTRYDIFFMPLIRSITDTIFRWTRCRIIWIIRDDYIISVYVSAVRTICLKCSRKTQWNVYTLILDFLILFLFWIQGFRFISDPLLLVVWRAICTCRNCLWNAPADCHDRRPTTKRPLPTILLLFSGIFKRNGAHDLYVK